MAYEDALTRLLDNLPQTYAQIKSIQSADEQRQADNLYKDKLLGLEREKLKNKTINDNWNKDIKILDHLGSDLHKFQFIENMLENNPEYGDRMEKFGIEQKVVL